MEFRDHKVDSSMLYSSAGLPVVRKLRQYSKESMAAAIDAVRSGRMRKSQAAQFFGVPRTTLLDKLSGRTPETYYSPCSRRQRTAVSRNSDHNLHDTSEDDQKMES